MRSQSVPRNIPLLCRNSKDCTQPRAQSSPGRTAKASDAQQTAPDRPCLPAAGELAGQSASQRLPVARRVRVQTH